MVGSAIVRQLEQRGDVEVVVRTRDELNLLDSHAVQDFFANERIDQVYLAAAEMSGIIANNTYPADFIYENMMIEEQHHSRGTSAQREQAVVPQLILYLPKMAKQPIAAANYLQGRWEATQRAVRHCYKLLGSSCGGVLQCQYNRDYRSVMPTNLYGPHDNFHAGNSHAIRRCCVVSTRRTAEERTGCGGVGQRHADARIPARG